MQAVVPITYHAVFAVNEVSHLHETGRLAVERDGRGRNNKWKNKANGSLLAEGAAFTSVL